MKFTLDPKNLPPNFSWITAAWLFCLSIEVWDMSPNWYWGVGVWCVLCLVGTAVRLNQTTPIDIFLPLERKK